VGEVRRNICDFIFAQNASGQLNKVKKYLSAEPEQDDFVVILGACPHTHKKYFSK